MSTEHTNKHPFDIERAIPLLRQVTAGLPRAALFALSEEGYGSPFEILLACMISIRTLDETTLPVAQTLFARARTPEQIAALSYEELDRLLAPCTFHESKARQFLAIAEIVSQQHGGQLPCDLEALLRLPGVGPKCANLVLGIACGQAQIGVDIHVHRVVNRWGYVSASTPEKTLLTLQTRLPRPYWTEFNALLMPFGKHVCTGTRPHCSTCPLLTMCQQIGVTNPR